MRTDRQRCLNYIASTGKIGATLHDIVTHQGMPMWMVHLFVDRLQGDGLIAIRSDKPCRSTDGILGIVFVVNPERNAK